MAMKVLLVLCCWHVSAIAQTQDRIAVLSGGGAYGAWGAGLSERLYHIRLNNRKASADPAACLNCGDYKIVIGTSTGSLMAPLVLVNRYPDLRQAYTSVTQKQIFNVNPFKENGELRGGLFLAWRFLFSRTLGESEPLRDLVRKFYTQQIHDEIKSSGKELIVTVSNMSDGEAYYMSSNKYAYDNSAKEYGGSKRKKFSWNSMVNWTWASANEPVFMSMFKTHAFDTASLKVRVDEKGERIKTEYIWQDGGITQAVSLIEGLSKAIENRIYNIDVIVHGTLKNQESSYEGKKLFEGLKRTVEILAHSVKRQNIEIGLLKQQTLGAHKPPGSKDFTVTIYYMTEEVRNMLPNANELVFKPELMNRLYDTGLKAKPDSTTFVVPIEGVREMVRKAMSSK